MTHWPLLLAIGIGQGLILAVALWSRPGHRSAPVRLGTLAVSIASLFLLEELFDRAGWLARWPHVAGTTMNLELALGPALLLLGRALRGSSRLKKRHWLHFLPYTVSSFALLPFFLASSTQKLDWLAHPPVVLAQFFALKGIHLLAYLGFAYLESAPGAPASSQGPAWFRPFLAIVFILGLVSFGLHQLSRLGFSLLVDSDGFSSLVLTSGLSLLVLQAVRTHSLHMGVAPVHVETDSSSYDTSPLSEPEAKSIRLRVRGVLNRERLYRDPELTLARLAERLRLPRHHVSQALNRGSGAGFYNEMNRLRLRDFLELSRLPENDSKPALDLALRAGFGSKAAFYRACGKHLGQTPSALRSTARRQRLARSTGTTGSRPAR